MTLYLATMLLAFAAAFVTVVALTQAELPPNAAALISARGSSD